MTTTNIITTPGLGDQETINSATFAARAQEFHPYDGSVCADPQRISQWAELKSSFLSQSIITEDNNKQTNNFMAALLGPGPVFLAVTLFKTIVVERSRRGISVEVKTIHNN